MCFGLVVDVRKAYDRKWLINAPVIQSVGDCISIGQVVLYNSILSILEVTNTFSLIIS